jgi:hypothetical protein
MNLDIWQPSADNTPSPLIDVIEDFARATVASAFIAKLAVVFSSTNPNNSFVNHIPFWAGKLLTKVKFQRVFGASFLGLSLYYGTYNYLTGVRNWPVTKYGEMHCAASCAAVAPAALAYAYLRRLPTLRAASNLASRIGRFYAWWAAGCLYFLAYNYVLSAGYDDGNVPRFTESDLYYNQLCNAPGFEIIAQLPHLPFYKETDCLPYTATRNPFHDAEYVKVAKANAKNVLEHYSL